MNNQNPKQELKPNVLPPNQQPGASPGGIMLNTNVGMSSGIPPNHLPSPKMPKPEPDKQEFKPASLEPNRNTNQTPRITSSPGPPSKRPKQELSDPRTPNPDEPKTEPKTDYLTVVKNPMDLKTIRHKLDTGAYTDPWGVVSDMWLMFENAWLYNRRNSRVYRMCSKLAEEFQRIADPAMRRAGFCCAQKLNFTPLPLCCFGKATCTINVGGVYYCYESGNQKNQLGIASDKIYYCEKCFQESKGSHMSTSEDNPGAATNTQPIPKDKFIRKKNDEKDPEQFLNCKMCGRQNHEICVLHKKEIWKEFICEKCQQTSKKRKENKFTASRLPECQLSKHIEDRVNRIRCIKFTIFAKKKLRTF